MYMHANIVLALRQVLDNYKESIWIYVLTSSLSLYHFKAFKILLSFPGNFVITKALQNP